MGNLKDEWMQQGNWKREIKLAELLGIRYDELEQTDWEIEDKTIGEGLHSKILVKFHEKSPADILEKNKGLDANHSILLDPAALEAGEDESEEYYEEGESG